MRSREWRPSATGSLAASTENVMQATKEMALDGFPDRVNAGRALKDRQSSNKTEKKMLFCDELTKLLIKLPHINYEFVPNLNLKAASDPFCLVKP